MAEKCLPSIEQPSIIANDPLLSKIENINKPVTSISEPVTADKEENRSLSSTKLAFKENANDAGNHINSNSLSLSNLSNSTSTNNIASPSFSLPLLSSISTATVPVTTKNVALLNKENGIGEKNNNDDEDDDDGDDFDEDQAYQEQHISLERSEKVDIYLETPVVDDNNEKITIAKKTTPTTRTMEIINTCKDQEYTIETIAAKPKRLSDEFFSADDGEYDNEDNNEKSSVTLIQYDNNGSSGKVEKKFSLDRLSKSTISAAAIVADTDDQTCAEMPRFEENSTDNLITRSSAYVEDEISSCSNLIDISNEHDESSPHSSVSPTIMSLDDDGDEANHDDEHCLRRRRHLDNIFYANDVQSMDAIERKDFENEQKLTGGIVLRGSSLISGDNRLNLGLLNTFSQKLDKTHINSKQNTKNVCEDDVNDNDDDSQMTLSSSSAVTDEQDRLATTPTSSRTKTIRLSGSSGKSSAAKINLAESLEKYSKQQSANESECVNISCNKLESNNSLGESSSAIIKESQKQQEHQQFDAFISCNSSDSLLSDQSCRVTGFLDDGTCINSNNFSSASMPNNVTPIASTSGEATTEPSILKNGSGGENGRCDFSTENENNSLLNNENRDELISRCSVTKNLECMASLVPSTSKAIQNSSSSNCQYSNHNCNSSNNNQNNELLHLDLNRHQNHQEEFQEENADDEVQIICSNVERQQPNENFEINDLPSSSSSQRSSNENNRVLDENNFNQLSIENHQDYDEDTWADCEDVYDIEEICTCQDYSDEEAHASSEDELPSRDVDLSGYTHLDSISEDILQEGSSSETPRNYRKRKLTETSCGGGDQTPGNRKRLTLESVVSPKLPCTPTSTPTLTITSPSSVVSLGISSERRTPRSLIPTRDNPPPELSDWLLQFQRWSHAERLLAVDRLIEHCEPTQVRHMMKVIEPQFQRDFISLLPKELALQVLSFLQPKDLLRAAQTCRSWRFLCDDNLLWKEKCKKTGIVIEPSTDRPKRGRAGNMPPISSPWKAAYMRQHIIEMNWRSRPIRSPKILKGHDDHVITCLQFCGNRIVSGSDDNTLKVWSAITGKCLRTLVGHTGGVWSSQMAGNIIISGSTDRTLKVWNADSGVCHHTLYGHTSTVRCMHLHGRKVVSGSRDATLRVWDIAQGKCLHILVGHLAAVRCVQYDGKLVVSGAYDYMVKVWNPERQECLHTLQGHTNRVYSLQFDGIHVVSGSLDTSIRVWDAETGSCKHTLMGHQSLTSGMELRQNILVSGNADSTVKVWDITTGQCLQTLSGPNKHQSAVTCLQFNSRFVVTSSDDGTVKLWDVRTGEFIRNLVALDSGGSGGVVWRIRANDTKLICAVGSRNGTEETKLMVLDFDVEGACLKCS